MTKRLNNSMTVIQLTRLAKFKQLSTTVAPQIRKIRRTSHRNGKLFLAIPSVF